MTPYEQLKQAVLDVEFAGRLLRGASLREKSDLRAALEKVNEARAILKGLVSGPEVDGEPVGREPVVPPEVPAEVSAEPAPKAKKAR